MQTKWSPNSVVGMVALILFIGMAANARLVWAEAASDAQNGTVNQARATRISEVDSAWMAPPVLAVGDTWTYKFENKMDLLQNRVITQTVRRVTEQGYEFDQEDSKGVRSNFNLSRSLNEYSRAGADAPWQEVQNYVWPLKVGHSWKFGYDAMYSNGRPARINLEGKVVGREQVTVPAGRFDAIKITFSGRYRGAAGRGAMKSTVWYAPKVKRTVKYLFTSNAARSMMTWSDSIMELQHYNLKEQASPAQ